MQLLITYVKEKIKHKGENNNVVAEAPPTCNPTNAREVGPQLKRLQRVWFGKGGKEPCFSILLGPLLGDALLGRHLYQNG